MVIPQTCCVTSTVAIVYQKMTISANFYLHLFWFLFNDKL